MCGFGRITALRTRGFELAFQIARAFGVGIDDLFTYPTDTGGAS